MKKIKRFVLGVLALFAGLSLLSCSELRSEFDPHEWRYAPFNSTPNAPPSWENDIGRPDDQDYSGEEPW